MARLKELAISRGSDVLIFDPDSIKEIDGYNARNMESPETKEHIRKMVKAIHNNGTLNFPPITIAQKNGEIFVFSGHCRRRAFSIAKKEGAPIKGIPAIINTQNEEERTLDLITSNDGLPLTQLEKANVIKRLISFGWTNKEIAEKIGVSIQTIYNLSILLNSPKEIKEMVTSGKITSSTAIKAIREEKSNAPRVLNNAIKKAGKKKAVIKKTICCPHCNKSFERNR